jgi:predicted Zn-dependent protease
VQALRGNYDAAAKLLQPLAASTADVDTAYLATMFLGALHDRRGRHNEATQMYRRAVDRIPTAQSAYLALSEALQRLGRGDESREVLVNLFQRPAEARTEPWWWYLAEPVGDARRRMDALRESVRK